MVGVWEGLNLGSIPNFFLCFGMHPKIIDVYPKLIPKGGVVQLCRSRSVSCPTKLSSMLGLDGTEVLTASWLPLTCRRAQNAPGSMRNYHKRTQCQLIP